MAKEQVKVTVKRKISLSGPTLLEKLIEYIKENYKIERKHKMNVIKSWDKAARLDKEKMKLINERIQEEKIEGKTKKEDKKKK